jgi:hypothetical protein
MAVWNPRANALFASLLELPPQRQSALDQACGADGVLRQQVEALLAAHAQAGNFLEKPPAGAAGDTGELPPGLWLQQEDLAAASKEGPSTR